MYEDAFETKFLKATEALYHEEGNRYMQETDVSYHYKIQYLYSDWGWIDNRVSKKKLLVLSSTSSQILLTLGKPLWTNLARLLPIRQAK